MSVAFIQKALAAVFVALVAIALSPVAEGREGTWQDVVGDIVWSGIFLTVGLIVVFGVVWAVRRTRVSD